MIPIRDLNPTRSRPVVTYTLIAINVAVFVYQLTLGDVEQQAFVERFGVVPYELTRGGYLGAFVTPFTSMFMHGGIGHILGNMWFLHIFGDNVEDALGKVRYILFYVLGGLAAVAAQVAIDPTSSVPMVGASGAIAAVIAGYVMLHPRAPILTVVPIFIFIQLMELPAFFFVFIWFGYQLLMGFVSLGAIGDNVGGVAFFAHIGGFVFGLAAVRLLRKKRHETHGFDPPRRSGRARFDRYDPWHRRG